MAKPQSDPALTHVNKAGEMHMVDVGHKPTTHRVAIAEAKVKLGAAAKKALVSKSAKKGDVLAAVRLAGIQAAKRTGDLIPLCHPLGLSHVSIEIETTNTGVRITSRTETVSQTGVEMEAMTAASVAALTLYDMLKAVERGITIESVRLLEKHGGKSGSWRRRGAK